MSYQVEFPDYPPATMPSIPDGFTDVSWRNDTCPSFRNETRELTIFVDFLDPEHREFPETKRFSVHRDGDDFNREVIADTDDWAVILEALL